MTDARTDAELLREYVVDGSREALGELARRYIDLVYSAARRHTRDPHLAEDVTQAVFILLSQRARKIGDPSRLIGWLYQTTYFTAVNALKLQRRRRHHEQACAAQEPIMTRGDEADVDRWTEIAPVVDQAMAQLDRASRDLLLMRYFQNKTVQQVAMEMGLSVHAAQKRLSRALEQLRGLLCRRGVTVSAMSVGAILLSKSVEAAPAAVHASVGAIADLSGAPSAASQQLVEQMLRWTSQHTRRVVAAMLALAAGIGSLIVSMASPVSSPAAPSQQGAAIQTADAGAAADLAAVSAWNESLANSPIPKPWPLAVPGCIAGAPITADLFGDGKTQIIVPCMELDQPHRGRLEPITHPHPTKVPLVYAFNLDGTTVPGFPAQLASMKTRIAGRKDKPEYSDDWFSSPSVVKIDGKDVIVIPGPNLEHFWTRALFVIRGNGVVQSIRVGDWKPDPNVPVCAVQLQKDGPIELLGGYSELVDGNIRRSRLQWNMTSAYDFCVGDPNGDGQIRLYQSAPRPNEFKTGNSVILGWDRFGHMLPGWPQACGGMSGWSTVMGDLLGDGKMEIIMPDGIGRILAWTADGQRFGVTYPEDPTKAKEREAKRGNPLPAGVPANELATSILKEGFHFASALSLADIDADGRAEIIFADRDHTLRAFHGDATGVGNADGIIARLPESSDVYGISVANLSGAEGAMDFFLGTFWVHRAPDGTATTIDMLPGAVSDRCQPTIVDVDGDGLADILVGTNDGRVFIYRTGKPYRRDRIHWATVDGDLNHTACWHNPDPTKTPGL